MTSPPEPGRIKTIRISHCGAESYDTYLQVGGVVAIERETGRDVALASEGATVSASSSNHSMDPGYAIDGQYPAQPGLIHHSATPSTSEYLDVILAHPCHLASVTVYGRPEICPYRDVYQLHLLNEAGLVVFSDVVDGSAADGQGTTVTLPATEPAADAPADPPRAEDDDPAPAAAEPTSLLGRLKGFLGKPR